MFSRLATKTARSLPSASTSSAPLSPPCCSASFSTSSTSHESKRLRKARLVRKAHIDKKASLVRMQDATLPDPVLGHAKGKDQLWTESLLAKTLLKREDVWGSVQKVVAGESAARTMTTQEDGTAEDEVDPSTSTTGEVYKPKHYNFGLKEKDVKLLTETLPNVAMMRDIVAEPLASDELNEKRIDQAEQREMDKREKLMRILDLRNAGSKGIQVENVRRIIRTFGRDETDSGRPEVQAAILTARIHSLLEHLVSQPRDIHNRRPLRSLIQQRAKVLKYLRSVDVRRYEDCLMNIGVEPRAVEGEVIVTKTGLRELIRGA